MTSNAGHTLETIAGVNSDVVSVLPPEDIAFLRLLSRMGLTLNSVYEKVQRKQTEVPSWKDEEYKD
jgi:hypothetical protein